MSTARRASRVRLLCGLLLLCGMATTGVALTEAQGTPSATPGIPAIYTSPTYGYTVGYDAATWSLADAPLVDDGFLRMDRLELEHSLTDAEGLPAFTTITVTGQTGYDGDSEQCVLTEAAQVARTGFVVDYGASVNADGTPKVARAADGTPYLDFTVDLRRAYVECRTVEPGSSVVVLTLVTFDRAYAIAVALARPVFDSLDLGRTRPGTPTADRRPSRRIGHREAVGSAPSCGRVSCAQM